MDTEDEEKPKKSPKKGRKKKEKKPVQTNTIKQFAVKKGQEEKSPSVNKRPTRRVKKTEYYQNEKGYTGISLNHLLTI